MPVGNDIVDLAAPGNPGKSGDDRFCARVFTAEERALITGAPSPDALLWALWAAKEAAYKAVSRGDPAVCSIPRQYRVVINGDSGPVDWREVGAFSLSSPAGPRIGSRADLDSPFASVPDSRFRRNDLAGRDGCRSNILSGKGITPRGELALRIELTAEWIHAFAAGSEEVLDRIFLRVESRDGVDDPSAFVRKGLLREIARFLDCEARDLSVIEDPDCPAAPGVLFRGCPLTKEVTLSHDGRFTAFAFDPFALIFSDLLV